MDAIEDYRAATKAIAPRHINPVVIDDGPFGVTRYCLGTRLFCEACRIEEAMKQQRPGATPGV